MSREVAPFSMRRAFEKATKGRFEEYPLAADIWYILARDPDLQRGGGADVAFWAHSFEHDYPEWRPDEIWPTFSALWRAGLIRASVDDLMFLVQIDYTDEGKTLLKILGDDADAE